MAEGSGRGDGGASNAALGDLREFIQQARDAGDLVVVKGADPHLEMGVIYELSQEKKYPPVLLFEDMVGCDPGFRVLSNVRNQRFMVGDLDLAALKAFRRRPKDRQEPIPPRELNTGPVFENVDEGDAVNILKFPCPYWHQGDGGAYIGTECLVITKDPDSDWVNVGTYRVKVHDKKTLTVFIEPGKQGDIIRRKYWARGQACPMAISVGQAPVLGSVAGTAYRPGQSEFSEAGGRLGRAIDVVSAKLTRLPIPERDNGDVTTSRIIIYAVRPFHWKDEFPKANEVDREFAESVRKKWKGRLPFL